MAGAAPSCPPVPRCNAPTVVLGMLKPWQPIITMTGGNSIHHCVPPGSSGVRNATAASTTVDARNIRTAPCSIRSAPTRISSIGLSCEQKMKKNAQLLNITA